MEKKVVGIIPARYKSSRLPGKPLVKLLDKPMIIWVAELSTKALGKENIYIATDDERIKTIVENCGYNVVMTSDQHLTGTDRIAEVASQIEADIYINIQGDEPTVDPRIIQLVVHEKQQHMDKVINAMSFLSLAEDPHNVNIPKVVINESNNLVYMSRLAVPGYKSEENKPTDYFKQVCIYAFTQEQLLKFKKFNRKSKLEKHEDIEILRFLDLNIPVRMVKVEGEIYAVDILDDVSIVEQRLKEIHRIK